MGVIYQMKWDTQEWKYLKNVDINYVVNLKN